MTHLRHENMPPVEAPRWKRFQQLLGRHGVIHVEDKRIAQRFYEYGISDAITEAREDIEGARRMVREKNEELEALREQLRELEKRSTCAYATAIVWVLEELRQARAEFPDFNSPHEGFAVLQEEVDELWEEVKNGSAGAQRNEAIQVAAMAIRFLHDCSGVRR